MKLITEDKLKVLALDYATKNKIVNQKTIQAFIDSYKIADKQFTLENIIKILISSYDKNHEYIENEYQTYLAYCGNELANKNRQKLLKQKDLAKYLKEFLKHEDTSS